MHPLSIATLPAAVRYDPELSPSAKLLFAEITALTPADGYCTAPVSYFASAFDVSERSVFNWIAQLIALGYIERTSDKEYRPTASAYISTLKKTSAGPAAIEPLAFQYAEERCNEFQEQAVEEPAPAELALKKISEDVPELKEHVAIGAIRVGTADLKKKPITDESLKKTSVEVPIEKPVVEKPVKSAKAVVQPVHTEYAKKFADLFNSWIPDGSKKKRVKAEGKFIYGIMKKYSATTADLDVALGWLTERGIAIHDDGNYYVEPEALSSLQTKWPKLMKEIDKVGYELPKVRTPEEIEALDRHDAELLQLHLQYMKTYVEPERERRMAYYASPEGQDEIQRARELLAQLVK